MFVCQFWSHSDPLRFVYAVETHDVSPFGNGLLCIDLATSTTQASAVSACTVSFVASTAPLVATPVDASVAAHDKLSVCMCFFLAKSCNGLSLVVTDNIVKAHLSVGIVNTFTKSVELKTPSWLASPR